MRSEVRTCQYNSGSIAYARRYNGNEVITLRKYRFEIVSLVKWSTEHDASKKAILVRGMYVKSRPNSRRHLRYAVRSQARTVCSTHHC